MKENTFKMITEDGKEVTCNVLFTFDSEETKKSYIAYTDNTIDDDDDSEGNGSIRAYAAVYHPEDLNKGFEPIETEKEWKVVETILSTIQEEVKKKQAELKAKEENQDDDEGENNE